MWCWSILKNSSNKDLNHEVTFTLSGENKKGDSACVSLPCFEWIVYVS